jgi:hypothetical protein
MLKPLSFQTTETSTDFQPVPVNMGYQDAVHMLKGDSAGPQVAQGVNGKR